MSSIKMEIYEKTFLRAVAIQSILYGIGISLKCSLKLNAISHCDVMLPVFWLRSEVCEWESSFVVRVQEHFSFLASSTAQEYFTADSSEGKWTWWFLPSGVCLSAPRNGDRPWGLWFYKCLVQLSEILTQADVPELKYACAVLRNMCNYSYCSQRAWQPGDLYASQRVSSHLLIKQVLRVFGEEPALGSYQRTFS